MLNRVLGLQAEQKELRENLLKQAENTIKSFKTMRAALETLPAMKALDEKEFTSVLSPQYIQSIRQKAADQAAAINVDIKQIEEKNLAAQIKSVQTLVPDVDALGQSLSDLPSEAESLDSLKKEMIQGIKDTLSSYFAYKKSLSEDQIADKTAKAASVSPNGIIKSNSPPLQIISQLLAQPLALLKEKIARVNSNVPDVNLTCELEGLELRFNNALDALPLSTLKTFANEVMRATWSNNKNPDYAYAQAFIKLQDKYKDLKCEWALAGRYYYLDMTPSLQERFEEKLTSLEQNFRTLRMEADAVENLVQITAAQTTKIKESNEFLVAQAREQAKNSTKFLTDLELKAAKTAASFKELAAENTALNELLDKDEYIPDDLSLVEEQKQKINKQVELIIKKREEAADKLIFGKIFKSKKVDPSPRYEAMKLSFGQAKKEYQNVLDETKTCLTKAEARLTSLNDKAEKIKNAELARQQELTETKGLRASLEPLQKILDKVNGNCEVLEGLQISLGKRDEEMANIYSRINENTPLSELKECLKRLEANTSEYKQEEGRYIALSHDTEKLLSNFSESSLSTSVKMGENLKFLIEQQMQTTLRLAECSYKPAAEPTPDRVAGLQEKIKAQQAKLIDELIDLLQVVFSEDNIKKFWKDQISVWGKRAVTDASKIDIGGHKYAVPRGVFNAHKALRKLSTPGADRAAIAEEACRAMKDRWEMADGKRRKVYGREKPTEVLYLPAVNGFKENKFVVSEELLSDFRCALKDASLSRLQGVEKFQPKQDQAAKVVNAN